VVYYQTQNTTRLENERKNGESSARQAIVIFALPQLLSYARECAFRKQKSFTQWSAGEGGRRHTYRVTQNSADTDGTRKRDSTTDSPLHSRGWKEISGPLGQVRSQHSNIRIQSLNIARRTRSTLTYLDSVSSIHFNGVIEAIKLHAAVQSVQTYVRDTRFPIQPVSGKGNGGKRK
jgi:hypothetical protein